MAPGAIVFYRPAAQLLVAAPPAGGVAACANLVQPPDGLVGEKLQDAYQAAIARYCTAPGKSTCATSLIGRANVDYTTAALQVVAQTFSPAQQIALERDRTRKLMNAQADAALADSICAGPDSDDDWVPDKIDKCPGTKALAATDEDGCPITKLPDAPSAIKVQQALERVNIMIDPKCHGAPKPATVSGAAFYTSGISSIETFITSTAVTNQPPGCSVWYLFEIRGLSAFTGAPSAAPFMVAFRDAEAIAHVANDPSNPLVPPGFIQFAALNEQAGTRGTLGSLSDPGIRISFRVQAINGAGARGQWSDWKETSTSDCAALGVPCHL